MKVIDNQLLEKVSQQASDSRRKRINFNFHETLDANVQRMLNAMEPGTYVQPHKHENPDKFEAFLILKGKVLVIEFENDGTIRSKQVLSSETGNLGVEILPCQWHSVISLEQGTIIYEVKDGPYSALNDKNFATWAPKEGSAGCDEYLKHLCQICQID